MLASIDIGNSQVKIGLFKEDKLYKVENMETSTILTYLRQNNVTNLIVSSVSEDVTVISALERDYPNLLVLNSDTSVPLKIDNKSPNTLGIDRVAAAIGAISQFKGPLIVVDAGSCITCDLVDNKNIFKGGTISRGLQMRLQAIHTFTSKLPLLNLTEPKQLVGSTTDEAMLSGALNGSRLEITGIVRQYQKKISRFKGDYLWRKCDLL